MHERTLHETNRGTVRRLRDPGRQLIKLTQEGIRELIDETRSRCQVKLAIHLQLERCESEGILPSCTGDTR